jgi:hypothetical protein
MAAARRVEAKHQAANLLQKIHNEKDFWMVYCRGARVAIMFLHSPSCPRAADFESPGHLNPGPGFFFGQRCTTPRASASISLLVVQK